MKTSFHFLKTQIPKVMTLTLAAAAVLAGTAFAQQESASGTNNAFPNPRKAMVVGTRTVSATVTAIDPETRKVTLTGRDGTQTTIKAGPEVRNFNQIHVGDQLKVTATESVAVSLHRPGTPSTTREATEVTVAPEGAMPSAERVDTTEVTAKITALDPKQRHLTLQLPDGSRRTVKAGDDVDLTGVKVGDVVAGRITSALAIRVEKPQ